jgi:hypothetical protein
MATSFDRRRFLLASSALGASAIVGLPRSSSAFDVVDEIIVWGTKAGTAIYDSGAILKMAKGMAFFMGGVMAAGSAVLASAGLGIGGFALADPDPGSKIILLALSGSLVLNALAWGGMAAVMNFIGADPPRSNYKVTVCKGAVTPVLDDVKGFPALNAHAKLVQAATQSARQFWDGIELWQGAQIAQDGEWMNIHFKSCVESYRSLHKATQELPAATEAAFEEIMAPNKLGNFEIQDLVAPHAGRTLGSIPDFKTALDKAAAQKTPCGDGIITPALELIYAQKVPANLRRAMKENVKELQKAAKGLNPPI